MILVRQDASIIPPKILAVADRAKAKLERIPPDQRSAFIKKKSHIWGAFKKHLAKMSHDKCWYSECKDCHSFYDVDHFRPKLEAKRSDAGATDSGYDWLAFSWKNFRFSASCSNRQSRNDETGTTDGKGSWFPLMEGSAKATWDDRCEDNEKPMLIDPVIKEDVALIDVLDDGRVGPAQFVVGTNRTRAARSCQIYGLNLPSIKSARLHVIREVNRLLDILVKNVNAATNGLMSDAAADCIPIGDQIEFLREMTSPESEFSRTARFALIKAGCAELCFPDSSTS
jgi:hypothetical protein